VRPTVPYGQLGVAQTTPKWQGGGGSATLRLAHLAKGIFFFPLFLYNYNLKKKKIIKDIFVLRGDIDILLVE
jgi:hypothetical protein